MLASAGTFCTANQIYWRSNRVSGGSQLDDRPEKQNCWQRRFSHTYSSLVVMLQQSWKHNPWTHRELHKRPLASIKVTEDSQLPWEVHSTELMDGSSWVVNILLHSCRSSQLVILRVHTTSLSGKAIKRSSIYRSHSWLAAEQEHTRGMVCDYRESQTWPAMPALSASHRFYDASQSRLAHFDMIFFSSPFGVRLKNQAQFCVVDREESDCRRLKTFHRALQGLSAHSTSLNWIGDFVLQQMQQVCFPLEEKQVQVLQDVCVKCLLGSRFSFPSLDTWLRMAIRPIF